ncbi:hypothetical protein WH390_06345 [Candidatus Arsenophonus nilaparvatae]|uniref:hypothetical protein n=1 Tax=Candidatus Arsenophonus nilaparvatae TaxID=1247023 RepID=UPI000509D426|nr:hypothetical protein [Candidatus Arsenophonus nilaparvatae]
MLNKINIIKDRPLIKPSQQHNQLKTNSLISKIKKIKNCFVKNNIHISTKIDSSKAKFYHQLMLRLNLDSSIQIKNYHLTSRLNQEYNSTIESVALQGSPKNLHSTESLSLPVCPFLLSQKLLQVKQMQCEEKTQNERVKLNGYVSSIK